MGTAVNEVESIEALESFGSDSLLTRVRGMPGSASRVAKRKVDAQPAPSRCATPPPLPASASPPPSPSAGSEPPIIIGRCRMLLTVAGVTVSGRLPREGRRAVRREGRSVVQRGGCRETHPHKGQTEASPPSHRLCSHQWYRGRRHHAAAVGVAARQAIGRLGERTPSRGTRGDRATPHP